MTVRLIRSIIGLALTSVILSIIMFRLNSPFAAVFELSICAGLISVIFITTVSYTQRVSKERLFIRMRERFTRFWYLPFIVVSIAVLLFHFYKVPDIEISKIARESDVRIILWNMRQLDLLGQVIILLIGVFGVVVLFKEARK